MTDHSHRWAKEATYYYTNENGVVLHRKIKKRCAECGDKTFTNQRRVGNAATYVNGIAGVRKVPYNLAALADAIADGHPVWVVEGEKDVETLRDLGEIATCSPDGAGSWSDDFAAHLKGASEVRLVADTDTPGRKYQATVRGSLAGRVGRISVHEPPDAKDISEHIENGGTLADLMGGVAVSAGIAAGLASQYAGAARRSTDPRLPGQDLYLIPAAWARVAHQADAATRKRVLNAPVIHHGTEGAVLAPTEVPVRCGGCEGFLMIETKPGAGRTCHRCRLTYETWSPDE